MRILLLECKKALASPVILCLLLLFSAWNVFVIYNHSFLKEELQLVNQIIEKDGAAFSDGSLAKLKKDLDAELAQLNSLYNKQNGQTFEHASAFFDQKIDEKLYGSPIFNAFYRLRLKEMYLERARSMDGVYEKFDIEKMGESEIRAYGLTGAAAETFRKENAKFAKRFEELKRNGEHRHWFFEGKQYAMHSLLFSTMFRHLVIEALILIVLASALITNDEFENRTQQVAYAARRGRKLMIDKLFASLTAAAILATFLFVTLGSYFAVFDYSRVWKSAISSGFNWEFHFPYVSWWNLPFWGYLLLGTILLYICMLLFSVLAFIISVKAKNSYYTFILFAVIFIALFLLPGFLPGSSSLKLMAGFNLSALVLNPRHWWMATGGLTMFKYHELGTIAAWTAILAVLCFMSLRTFAKQDIS
jgi:hypothetical protein